MRDAAVATPSGAMKMSVRFAAPADPAVFDKSYFENHMPPTRDVKGARFETSMVQLSASGAAPAVYRRTEFCFESSEHMRVALSSTEMKKVFSRRPRVQPPGDDRTDFQDRVTRKASSQAL